MAIGITAVRIRGFRSHVDTYVKLTPIGLNVITGKNDSGKTALLQAIRWVALGEPEGEEFLFTKRDEAGEIIDQAEEAYVMLELSTGVTVEKTRRRKGKTKYKLSTIPEPFEQAAVPDEVKAALGIRTKYFGDYQTDLNFAYQLAAPFLVSETPSAGAKVLGTLAGTEAVDLAIKGTSKDQYAARTARQQADKDAQQREKDLQQYVDLEQLKEAYGACEYLLSEAETATLRGEKLSTLYIKLYELQGAVSDAEKELDRLADVPELAKDMEDIGKAQQRYERLLDLYERKGRLDQSIGQWVDQLEKYAALPLTIAYLEDAEGNQVKLDTLARLSFLGTEYTQDVEQAAEILEKTIDLDIRVDDLRTIEALTDKADKLWNIENLYKIRRLRVDQIAASQKLLTHVPEAALQLQEAIKLQDKLTRLYEVSSRHTLKATTLKRATASEITASGDAERYQKELAAAWDAAGGSCPLCDQPVGKGGCSH